MRCVRTRVLPEPAPATMSSGPSTWVTASAWTGFSPSRSGSWAGLMGHPTYWPPRTLRSERDRAPGRRRGAARQPQPAPPRLLRRHRVRHAEPRPAGGPLGAVHEPPHRIACRACRPATTCSWARSTSRGGRGDRSRCGRTRSPRSCASTRASPRCSSPTTRTSSRRAARTTTPTSGPGTTCGAMKTTRGGPAPTPPGSAPPPFPCAARPGSAATTCRAPGSRTKPTSQARRPWRPPRAGSTASWPLERAPEERALLVVDEFDPHEPFDVPEPWASRYDPDWEGERLIWPPYARSQAQSGLSDRESVHLRSQYGAKLSMIDHWLGRILEVVDRHDAWDTTAFILCTDHGHYLGERGLWGKPQVAVHPELGHIPLLVSWPGVPPGHQRRPHDHRRPARHPLRRLRRDARAPHPRALPRAAARRHGVVDPGVGAVRRVGPRGPRRRRHPHAAPRRRSRPTARCR